MNTEKNFFVVLMVGPPGSGKGTQAKLLAEKFGLYHFITSQILREYFESHNDPETRRQKKIFEEGKLVKPRWVLERVKEKTIGLMEDPSIKGIVYDGSPRTLYEAENLVPFLAEMVGRDNIVVLEIDVSPQEIKKRLGKRLICSGSAEHIFIRSDELKPGSECPEGDGVLKERDLDRAEIIETRIEEYQRRTKPGLDYLKEKYRVVRINGEQSIEDVHKEITKKLERWLE